MRNITDLPLSSWRIAIIRNNDFHESETDSPVLFVASKSSIIDVASSVQKTLIEQGIKTVDIHPIERLSQIEKILESNQYDFIFNLCETIDDDEKMEIEVVKLIESYNIPFSGNNSRALKLSLDKFKCNSRLQKAGVTVPESHCISSIKDFDKLKLDRNVYIVKPNDQDGSNGIEFSSVTRTRDELFTQVSNLLNNHNTRALIQEYIDGREINFAFINNKTLIGNCTEIDFTNLASHLPRVLNYSSKWQPDTPEYGDTKTIRAELSTILKERIDNSVAKTLKAIKLDSYGRIDFRISSDDIPYVVDVNPNCDLGDTSGFALAANYNDIPYSKIVFAIMENAFDRYQKNNPTINNKNFNFKRAYEN